jgi:hypothetical protein
MTKAMLALMSAMVISALGCKCGDDPCDPQRRRGDYRSPWRHHDHDDDEVCGEDGATPADATGDAGSGGAADGGSPRDAGHTGGAVDAGGARDDAGSGAAADAPCNDPPPAT